MRVKRRIKWVKWYLSLPQSRIRMLIAAIWAIPAVLLIRVLPLFREWQFATFENRFIGHITVDTAVQIALLQSQDKSKSRWFWIGRTDNRQWETMMRRTLKVHDWVCPIEYWNRKLPGGDRHRYQAHFSDSRDLTGLIWSTECQPPFSPEEDAYCRSWLASLGIAPGDPFVTLIVRDGEYTALTWPEDLSFHDYRNCDIETFIPAMNWLAEQGVCVIRMGKIMKKPLQIGSCRVIDYAFRADKSDLLDIWLMANATGCISTGTGLDSVAVVYRRPTLFLNALSLGILSSYAWCTWVPKDLRESDTGRLLSVYEHLDHVYSRSSQFHEAGLEVVSLSPNEILEEVQDWWLLLTGQVQESSTDMKSHDEFVRRLRTSPNTRHRHGWIHPEMRLGRPWFGRRRNGHGSESVQEAF